MVLEHVASGELFNSSSSNRSFAGIEHIHHCKRTCCSTTMATCASRDSPSLLCSVILHTSTANTAPRCCKSWRRPSRARRRWRRTCTGDLLPFNLCNGQPSPSATTNRDAMTTPSEQIRTRRDHVKGQAGQQEEYYDHVKGQTGQQWLIAR